MVKSETHLKSRSHEAFPSLKLRIALSLGAFILSFGTLQWQMQRARSSQLKAEEDVFVWIAAGEISPSDPLSKSLFRKKWQPASSVDPSAIRSELEQILENMSLRTDLQPGATLLERDLLPVTSQVHLASQVEKGRRLYRLSEQANPFGWSLQNGDLVDLFWEVQGRVKLLVESVKVVREQSLSSDRKQGRCGRGVQISLSIDALARVLAAEGKGNLRVALRNPEDKERSEWQESRHPSAKVKRSVRSPKRRIEHVR